MGSGWRGCKGRQPRFCKFEVETGRPMCGRQSRLSRSGSRSAIPPLSKCELTLRVCAEQEYGQQKGGSEIRSNQGDAMSLPNRETSTEGGSEIRWRAARHEFLGRAT